MRKLLFSLFALVLLAGVAVYTGVAEPVIKWQVERSLAASGMSDKQADCMAGRMVDRLTLGQLWKLRQAMAPRAGEPEQADSLGEIVKRLRRVDDFEAVAVVTTSSGLCSLGIG